MEQNLLVRPDLYADREDPYSTVKQDFSKIFYENNLSSYASASDIGLLDYGKNYYDQYHGAMDDQHHAGESNHHASHNAYASKEDISHYTDVYHNGSYNAMGRASQAAGHYAGAGYGYPGHKHHGYQQEYSGYGNYGQGYYYPNHYDHQMMQNSHEAHPDNYLHANDMVDTHTDDPLSLMWSEQTSKSMKGRNMAASSYMEHNTKPKLAGNYGAYEQEDYTSSYYNRNYVSKAESQMNHRKSFDAYSMEPTSHNVNTSAGSRHGTGMQSSARPHPSLQESNDYKYDNDDDDDEDGFGEQKGRSSRGLRVLSLRVREIVQHYKKTTYKDVADHLTRELRQKAVGPKASKDEVKDEQNVKRRVYDALNVLIAAGVLQKEGKLVYAQGSNVLPARLTGTSGNKDKLNYDLQESKKRIKAKAELLQELIFKCLAIKNLIKTNKVKAEREAIEGVMKPKNSKVSATRIEVNQDNAALNNNNEDVIKFPFIVLLSSSNDNSMNLNMDSNQKQLAIESKKPFNIFGDIDVLLKMGLHFVPKEMFEKSIPYELQRFVPKYYLAALK